MGAASRIPAADTVLTVRTAARELGLTETFIVQRVRCGMFPKPANVTEQPRCWRFSRRAVDAWLEGERYTTVEQVAS